MNLRTSWVAKKAHVYGLVLFAIGAATVGLMMGPSAHAADAKKALPASKPDPATEGIMQSIFQPITAVLPLSFDDEAFKSPKNKAFITAKLKLLNDNIGGLERHARGKDRAFEFVAKSLKLDAGHLYRWYTKDRFDEARFTLHNMTENCITCHSSLPETHKVPAATAFFSAIKTDAMPPVERAHFYVLSRQFDEAAKTYEEFFRKDVPPTSLVVLGSFTDYLKVCASVLSDLKRPHATIDAVLARKDVPEHVRAQLTRWAQALGEYEANGMLAKTDLPSARQALNTGKARMEFPRDRDGLIDYLVASTILNRYVHTHPDHGVDVAEAYYMLGISESLLSHSFWISREEFDFESAIRLAPSTDFAPKAYAQLEESYVTNYSGSGGTHIPDDVKELLTELRQIIEQARGRKS